MVDAGVLAPDVAQELAAEKLELLANRLLNHAEPNLGVRLNPVARKRQAPDGLYLYGGVGRGKTMLLDLFFDAVSFAPKRRVHFQEFMAEAHTPSSERAKAPRIRSRARRRRSRRTLRSSALTNSRSPTSPTP
jgi:cell division protein ZapE